MTDAERALSVLIHDVRSPLGVAQGYLRLVREGRIADAGERDAVLVRTVEALGRIGRLCTEAEAFLESGETTATTSARAKDVADRVAAHAREHGLVVGMRAIDAEASLRVGAGSDRLAEAVTLLLGTTPKANDNHTVTICVDDKIPELQFLRAPDEQIPALTQATRVSFDPWRRPGLAVALACRAITTLGGCVWTAAGAPYAIAIAIPLESSRT